MYEPASTRTALAFTVATGNLMPPMSNLSQDDIKNALKAVKYPGYSRDIISFGLIKEISAANGAVSVTMQLTSANAAAAQQIKADSERVLKALPGVNHLRSNKARAVCSKCQRIVRP